MANTPINPEGFSRSDRLIVPPTQQVKADKEAIEEIAKKNPQGLLMAGFCAYVQKTTRFLIQSSIKKRGVLSGGGLEACLMEFKKYLVTLSQEDQSRSQDYIAQLSKGWHVLLENFNLVEFLERKKSPLIAKVKLFIESIRAYPLNEEHSLGFYMTEFVGREWLPFPFMDLLKHLHNEFHQKKDQSQLAVWVGFIDQLLLEFKHPQS